MAVMRRQRDRPSARTHAGPSLEMLVPARCPPAARCLGGPHRGARRGPCPSEAADTEPVTAGTRLRSEHAASRSGRGPSRTQPPRAGPGVGGQHLGDASVDGGGSPVPGGLPLGTSTRPPAHSVSSAPAAFPLTGCVSRRVGSEQGVAGRRGSCPADSGHSASATPRPRYTRQRPTALTGVHCRSEM